MKIALSKSRACLIALYFSTQLLAPFVARSQENYSEVKGLVHSENNEPVIGASVTIRNTQTNFTAGVQTDTAGIFSAQVPVGGPYTFIVSNIGYEQQVLSGYNLKEGVLFTIDVSLKSTSAELNQVVVVGYGTQKQKDVTGSVAAISNKDFNQGVVLSPQQSIQGKVTGVNISQNSGKPGGSNTIRIRGGTSLTQSNDPLYVIDGVPISNSAGVGQANINTYSTDIFDMEPTNPLMTLNPDDIESVTVLKDASAAAIYGSRGANGVIVITTKRGTAGKSKSIAECICRRYQKWKAH